ncbi:MAG TPA: hypothetical protein VF265_02140 [Nevskiaceae bacterium]
MLIEHVSTGVNRAAEFVEVGGLSFPRLQLAALVADVNRFERCCGDARRLKQDMNASGGDLPHYAQGWTLTHFDEVLATIQDLAALAYVAAVDEKRRRRASDAEDPAA